MRRLCVAGAGAFGTALAQVGARCGLEVRLWGHRPRQIETLQATRRNPDYLSDTELHPSIIGEPQLARALERADAVIVAVPSQGMRSFIEGAAEHIPDDAIVISAAKGLEAGSLGMMHQVLEDSLGQDARPRIGALSGPSFAHEMVAGMPTAVVIAGHPGGSAQRLSEFLFDDAFRAYQSEDLVGVELAGALKNVVAIAAGAAAGMNLGSNAAATLMTRGLAEITRIAVAQGGSPLTLLGLAGMGDIILTCSGAASRNRRFGEALGEGLSVDDAITKVASVVEGYKTTAAAKELASKLGVEAPIIEAQYRVLFEGQPIKEALSDLVRRRPKTEL